jgi:hypothetical protein
MPSGKHVPVPVLDTVVDPLLPEDELLLTADELLLTAVELPVTEDELPVTEDELPVTVELPPTPPVPPVPADELVTALCVATADDEPCAPPWPPAPESVHPSIPSTCAHPHTTTASTTQQRDAKARDVFIGKSPTHSNGLPQPNSADRGAAECSRRRALARTTYALAMAGFNGYDRAVQPSGDYRVAALGRVAAARKGSI